MFLLDNPYVSDFLRQSVETMERSVVDTPAARTFMKGSTAPFIDETEFARRILAGERVYTNSENGLDVILRNAGQSDLARQIEICKDKALFRETGAALYPDYRFARVTPDDLDSFDVSDMPYPFVAKPARGFFSLGVHMVFEPSQWPGVVEKIRQERESLNAEYPEEVVNSGEFILEQGIDGEEYAIDVYYDDSGRAVITNILYHQFASEDDVSDRLYYTSPEIIEAKLEPFTEMVTRIGQACSFRNFCTHIEVRETASGEIIPIEANPLRFAGWCVTDMTHHAWGFSPYEYYFGNIRPDWPTILEARRGNIYAMVIGDVPGDVDRTAIKGIDYDGFCDQFEEVLELRKMDYATYPLFAMVFTRTSKENAETLKAILKADFSRFIE